MRKRTGPLATYPMDVAGEVDWTKEAASNRAALPDKARVLVDAARAELVTAQDGAAGTASADDDMPPAGIPSTPHTVGGGSLKDLLKCVNGENSDCYAQGPSPLATTTMLECKSKGGHGLRNDGQGAMVCNGGELDGVYAGPVSGGSTGWAA
ncbi:hypothetical protein OG317_37015 [Streptomyces sp. NBC_01167]|uniref:hypothetical protein n=1 Tax=Streptomyces sp. NBC_01167 TaxID=2903756 RepID=UPI00386463FB|nr:hypothetical protein OG317_37015 [Streptomyces sp. NBC_01167]